MLATPMYRSRRHRLRQDMPLACDVPGLLLASGGVQHTALSKSHTTASEAAALLEGHGQATGSVGDIRYNMAAICNHFRHLWRPLLVLYVMLPATEGPYSQLRICPGTGSHRTSP